MDDFVNFLQHRIAETKGKLEDANKRMQQAIADRELFTADLQGYERSLSAEMRDQGVKVLPQAQQSELSLNGDNGGELNKTELARQFFRGHPQAGATPSDLFKGFQDAGIQIKKPYIYALVQRLQKQTAIRSRRGRWYPVPISEQSNQDGNADAASMSPLERLRAAQQKNMARAG